MNLSLNLDKFYTQLKPFTSNFWDIAHSYKLFASKYIRYDDMISLLKFFIYLLFTLGHLSTAWQIPPLIPFSTVISISVSVNNSNFTLVFLRQACNANLGADKKWAGSSLYILIHLSLKFSNTSASNNVSLLTCKSWYSPRFLFQILPILFEHAHGLYL